MPSSGPLTTKTDHPEHEAGEALATFRSHEGCPTARMGTRGLILVAAAGNSGREKDTVGHPAKFDTVIAVSATDENDEIADWSSRGPSVELAAPGEIHPVDLHVPDAL